MIRHIVFFSAKAPEDIDTICETLRGYAAIPGVGAIEVARNARLDLAAGEVDIVLYAEFASVDALEAYKRHPIYEAGTARVRPLRELRFVADYEAQTS